MLNKFTPEFKALVSFILIVGAFALLGFNQLALNKQVNTAVSVSTDSLNTANSVVKQVKQLEVTPTAVPTATPSAVRIFTPASATKPLVK